MVQPPVLDRWEVRRRAEPGERSSAVIATAAAATRASAPSAERTMAGAVKGLTPANVSVTTTWSGATAA